MTKLVWAKPSVSKVSVKAVTKGPTGGVGDFPMGQAGSGLPIS